MDTSKIRSAPDIGTLRIAVAEAFEAISIEQTNSEKIDGLETRLKVVEEKP